jgi:multidrug efflux pump subunit AcrA (membrane-fusion protein)
MYDDEVIAAPLRELLSIFEAELSEVKFGDVDGASLAAAAAQVRERAETVAAAEAALAAARGALEEAQEGLLARGQRALAYARIYAEERPELAARLEAVSLSRSGRRAEVGLPVAEAPARRRGRPPKAAPMATLPLVPQESAEADEAALGGE